ncbi:hypothetical protein [Weissella confusa]|uniref:hypothetical protein n=1 Tax=Weissella confusa TaxID=1583 RepID=UPI0005DAA1D6|nr:hypothetical protein [Weissella confusa]TGE61116.1 hypothetical protein C6P21_02805 [Weissella confusa]COI17336.1 Uncharacterised protein [Streptococcus pneumoniae]
MRKYYYFRDKQGYFKLTYTPEGKRVMVRTPNKREAYRTSSKWLIKYMVSKWLVGYYYWVEEGEVD